jgi:hypothetical protein
MHVPKERLLHWKQLDVTKNSKGIPSEWKNILVVGGGLTAVQVAQLALKHGSSDRKVVLCSRRPIVEKHLDIGLGWVDRRQAQRLQFDFYHQPVQDRVDTLKEARGGGSVPPYYLRQVESLETQGRLQRLVGNPNLIYLEDLVTGQRPELQRQECQCCRQGSPLVIGIGSIIHRFDGVLVACGVQPDCNKNPVFKNLLHTFDSSKQFNGLPMVSEDLEWFPNIFVVGGMAGLNLGPDAGNLMGARRGATIIANALDCRSWLREKGNIFANRYNWIAPDSSSSESDSNDDEGPSDK